MRNTITVVDFGTSKIVALVARMNSGTRCDILSAGNQAYDGYQDARWNNEPEIVNAIKAALANANAEAYNSKYVYVGVPGQFCRFLNVEVKTDLQGANPSVTKREMDILENMAMEQLQNVDGEIIYLAPAWYQVDSGRRLQDPENQHGTTLRALYSIIVAERYFVEDVKMRFAELNKEVFGFYSTVFGQANYFVNENDNALTSVIIDVGYLCTQIAFMEGEGIIHYQSIPIGGAHMTADLAYGLELQFDKAEQIKRGYYFNGKGVQDSFDVVLPTGATQQISREQVDEVLLPRVDELCEAIKETIENSGIRLSDRSNVYLTGGGLVINRGGKEYLGDKLNRTVREFQSFTSKLSNPIYSSSLGLLDHVMSVVEFKSGKLAPIRQFFGSLFGR